MTSAVISVSRLVELFKELLEDNFVEVLVEGEISNFSRAGSGHCYFTLKDDRGQLRCAMFRSQARLLRFAPENGLQVICRGRASVYPQRGELQLIVEGIEPAGIGGMQLAFEQLKQKLAAEGLFDADHKKALPEFPKVIGVVTSAHGAAIHDILNILRRRAVGLRVLLRPVLVQGEGAAPDIAAAIADLNREADVDVLIVGRGGGSQEDLWAFNDELVARAIHRSVLPVISAVGHETDFSIADMVADLRVPTPTAAAELVVKNRQELERHCDQLLLRLWRVMNTRLELVQSQFNQLQRRLVSPLERLRRQRERLADLQERLARSMNGQVNNQQNRLQQLAKRLDAMSPLRVLGRGYALATRLSDGSPLRDVAQIKVAEQIAVQLSHGRLEASVSKIVDEKKAKRLDPGFAD